MLTWSYACRLAARFLPSPPVGRGERYCTNPKRKRGRIPDDFAPSPPTPLPQGERGEALSLADKLQPDRPGLLHMPAVCVVRGASAFGGDHRGAQRILRRAFFAEGRAVVRFFQA